LDRGPGGAADHVQSNKKVKRMFKISEILDLHAAAVSNNGGALKETEHNIDPTDPEALAHIALLTTTTPTGVVHTFFSTEVDSWRTPHTEFTPWAVCIHCGKMEVGVIADTSYLDLN
jgi:hypothetical protein